jgi:protein required for attachment to host cells
MRRTLRKPSKSSKVGPQPTAIARQLVHEFRRSLEESEELTMDIPNGAFVVVADGEKMLLFRNQGDDEFPHLIVVEESEQESLANRELRRDIPGRSFSSVGPGRSAYDEADSRQLGEDRFAAQTVDMLNRRALENEFASLVIVAPPRTLGELRSYYHSELNRRLIGEVPKNLTNLPLPDIERILKES